MKKRIEYGELIEICKVTIQQIANDQSSFGRDDVVGAVMKKHPLLDCARVVERAASTCLQALDRWPTEQQSEADYHETIRHADALIAAGRGDEAEAFIAKTLAEIERDLDARAFEIYMMQIETAVLGRQGDRCISDLVKRIGAGAFVDAVRDELRRKGQPDADMIRIPTPDGRFLTYATEHFLDWFRVECAKDRERREAQAGVPLPGRPGRGRMTASATERAEGLKNEAKGEKMPENVPDADETKRLVGDDRYIAYLIYGVNHFAVQYFEDQLLRSDEATAFCRLRGVSEASLRECRVGYAPDPNVEFCDVLRSHYSDALSRECGLLSCKDDGTFISKFRGRLMFPIHDDQGRVVAFSGICLSDPGEKKAPRILDTPACTPVYERNAPPANLKNIATRVLQLQLLAAELDVENGLALAFTLPMRELAKMVEILTAPIPKHRH